MIKFGTGGWRAIIAEDFTKANVQLLAQSLCEEINDNRIVIGYDRRFLSDYAAIWLSEVFAGNNIKVHLIDKASPTPLIMYATKKLDTQYGLAVTASHNPAIYNGIKIFTKGGKDATESVTQLLEKNLSGITEPKTLPFNEAKLSGLIEILDLQNDYIDSILEFVDTNAIRQAKLKVLVDTMHGVSKTSLSTILNTARCDVDIINDRHDTLFGGKLPSPASSTLRKLSDMVVSGNYNLGIATDGDADRLGIIDETGKFVHPNTLLSLLYYYLLEYKKITGPVVRNLSTTHLLDKIAVDYGQVAIETPVGFKHITQGMEENDAIIGGESSGGLTIKGHISGKDGIFAATLLVEMIAVTGKSVGELVTFLKDKYGNLEVIERDYSFSNEDKTNINNTLMVNKVLPDFNEKIEKIDYFDGIKIVFIDGSWISARFSGTEPLLRIFAESENIDKCIDNVNRLEAFLGIVPNFKKTSSLDDVFLYCFDILKIILKELEITIILISINSNAICSMNI